MCEFSIDQPTANPSEQRRRIWEVNAGWHCSIVGTCLTVRELRSLAKKLSLKVSQGISRDYQLHGFFSKQAGEPDRPAKMLNKLLNKKHVTTIRKLRGVKTENELHEFWGVALEAGNIPGPYWAILSHPWTTTDLAEFMFAEVHMLSHLVGASNRVRIRLTAPRYIHNRSGMFFVQHSDHLFRCDRKIEYAGANGVRHCIGDRRCDGC